MGSRHITIQTVDDKLRERVIRFLKDHPRIPSISALAKAGLENYMTLAEKYGIDANWNIQVPCCEEKHDATEAR